MKRTLVFFLSLALLALGLTLSCGGKGKTLVSVNGKDITEGDIEFLAGLNPRIKMQLATPFGKKQILENLVDQELLYQAALKKGLQRDSAVKAKLDLYKKVVIGQSYVEDTIEKAAKDYYEKNKPEFEKLQLSDIAIKFTVPEEKKAEKGKPAPKAEKAARSKEAALKLAGEVKARLDKGEEFAKVAKEVSEDPMAKNNGGDLGKASRAEARLERRGYGPLLEKAFTMQVGEVAGPIETRDGYHIITVTKGAELEPFEQAEQAIVFKMQGDERNKIMADLKKDAKIVWPGEERKKGPKPEAKPSEAPTQPEGPAPAAEPAQPEGATAPAPAPASK
jgi:peptidyl-prolyl cis-trans isomerase C